jgi:16S rRNA (cytidine1402-2'-O)-methyltransferase
MQWLSEVAETPHTFSFFETPHRIQVTLSDSAVVFGIRPICVARELTKVHQEFMRGTALEVGKLISSPRGEFTVVVGPNVNTPDNSHIAHSDEDISREFYQLTNKGAPSRRAAVTQVALKLGRTPKEIYAAIERARKLVV